MAINRSNGTGTSPEQEARSSSRRSNAKIPNRRATERKEAHYLGSIEPSSGTPHSFLSWHAQCSEKCRSHPRMPFSMPERGPRWRSLSFPSVPPKPTIRFHHKQHSGLAGAVPPPDIRRTASLSAACSSLASLVLTGLGTCSTPLLHPPHAEHPFPRGCLYLFPVVMYCTYRTYHRSSWSQLASSQIKLLTRLRCTYCSGTLYCMYSTCLRRRCKQHVRVCICG